MLLRKWTKLPQQLNVLAGFEKTLAVSHPLVFEDAGLKRRKQNEGMKRQMGKAKLKKQGLWLFGQSDILFFVWFSDREWGLTHRRLSQTPQVTSQSPSTSPAYSHLPLDSHNCTKKKGRLIYFPFHIGVTQLLSLSGFSSLLRRAPAFDKWLILAGTGSKRPLLTFPCRACHRTFHLICEARDVRGGDEAPTLFLSWVP